ncbi:MAG TPA: transglutaminase family protein [Caulobacteraceae bacterium]|jgi:YD repeat-containing protein|nr:transglutaminase family protein [Caulobacteraceae bacterium]
MTRLIIRHETRYDYDRPVRFGPHRLLVRPRDSHAMRLVDASLELSPPGDTRWVYDAMSNCVCWFTPRGEASQLRIVSNLTIDRYPSPLAPIEPDDPKSVFPLVYGEPDRAVLGPFIAPATTDPTDGVLTWMRAHLHAPDERVLDVLSRINSAIHRDFEYGVRDEEGTQEPMDTIERRAGTCRDFAWLMVEAVRRLGCAAVFVTGYLYSPNLAWRGAGATHAWCEAFLPGLGWIEFDPTNGLVESPDLIRVGATRTPAEAAPVAGNVIGETWNAQLAVSVDVQLDERAAA